MLSIVLIEPKNSGNLGAIARAMKNFGLTNLILINPKCRKDSIEAKKRAKHANDILEKAKVKQWKYLKTFDTLIATTASLGTDYNIPRSPITPKQLADKLKENNIAGSKTKAALILGREGIGLTNNEISQCDFVVTIPSHKEYPTLNLSQAAVVLFYELFKSIDNNENSVSSHITPASTIDKRQVLKLLNQKLNKLEFSTPEKKQTQKTVWKRLVGKSFLTKREAFALCGFFRKLK